MSSPEPSARLRGGCTCGAVRYEVQDAFVCAVNCHCSACRRTTGSAFKPFAGIPRDRFAIIRGADALLTLGTLDDAPTIRLTGHVLVGSKAPWFTIPDDLPQHEAFG